MGRNKGFKLTQEHKNKISESCKNAIVVHHIDGNHFNDVLENRMLLTPSEHVQLHIMQGDIKAYGGCDNGRKKGHIVTKETRRKISLGHIGKKHSEKSKEKMRQLKLNRR